MKKVPIQAQTHLELDGIQGFIIRGVTKFGNSAKVDCPKEYLRTLKILGGRFKLNEQDVVLAFDYTDEDFYGEVQGF